MSLLIQELTHQNLLIMKKNNLILFMMFSVFLSDAQELVQSYYYADGYNIMPSLVLERDDDIVVPFSITKENEKKAGIVYLNKNNSIKDAILFQGQNNYVINDIIESDNGNLLVSAEGYSEQGQESLYFIELDNNKIINEFVFNENGNELDPFAILETGNNILIGGFVKSRELVSNAFYNMYSEKQMIYLAEFAKEGERFWSKGIDIKGYTNGVCKKMIKLENGIIMLCHATKENGKISPILISIDNNNNISKIVTLSNSNYFTIGCDIKKVSDGIELVGSVSTEDQFNLFRTIFSLELSLLNHQEFKVPYKINLNRYADGLYVGAALTDEESFNNFLLDTDNHTVSLYEFGNQKINVTVSFLNNFGYSYTINNSPSNTSTLDIYNLENLEFSILPQKITELNINEILDYNIINSFLDNTINTGVKKVDVINVYNKLR
jgi:hypothetical protein